MFLATFSFTICLFVCSSQDVLMIVNTNKQTNEQKSILIRWSINQHFFLSRLMNLNADDDDDCNSYNHGGEESEYMILILKWMTINKQQPVYLQWIEIKQILIGSINKTWFLFLWILNPNDKIVVVVVIIIRKSETNKNWSFSKTNKFFRYIEIDWNINYHQSFFCFL